VFNVPNPNQRIIGHFRDESFQSITFTCTDNLTRTTTKRQNTQNNTTPKKVALVNSTTDTLRKPYAKSQYRQNLYDITPGNGAGLFLQPRSPHGAAPEGKSFYCFRAPDSITKFQLLLAQPSREIRIGMKDLCVFLDKCHPSFLEKSIVTMCRSLTGRQLIESCHFR